jgi:hypothetical protein
MARHARLVGGVVALTLASIPPAQAYIDPGTGSMLLQMFGAAIVGALFYFREMRMKITAFFSRRPAPSADPGNETAGDDSAR